jgi:SAM-dependent methyltransferase
VFNEHQVVAEQGLSAMAAGPYAEFSLRCPNCLRDVAGIRCLHCNFLFEQDNGIVRALAPNRFDHYKRFIKEYELIRAAEGRGSESDDFYLALPYEDRTGRNSGQWKIRSKSFDYLVHHVVPGFFPGSRVLDLGAGNCWMSFRLMLAGYRACAVDLLINHDDGLAAAAHFRRHLSADIPRFQAELHNLPFTPDQFDAVIFNASFHYSEDYEKAIGEALRCLRRNGLLIVMDSPWYSAEISGQQMLTERRALFESRYKTASDSVRSMEFLTDDRLRRLEQAFSIQWTVHRPWYGTQWELRPWFARIRGKREPSQFRIYVAIKDD